MPRKPKKQSRGFNPLKMVLITGLTLLLLMVVVLLIVKSSVDGWLRGEGFRQLIVNKASSAMTSEIHLSEMKWQGAEVYADQFRAVGYEGAPFAELNLDGVRVKTGGVKGGAFRVPEASVNRLGMEFSERRRDAPRESEVINLDPAGGPGVPEWARQFLPHRAEVDQISIGSTQISVLNSSKEPVFLLKGARGKVRPDFQTQIWEVLMQGGSIQVPNQEEIGIRELAMRWKRSELFLDRCSLTIFDDGNIDAAGEISFGDEGLFDIDLDLSSINVDDLLTGEWKERLDGIVEGPVKVTGQPGALIYEGQLSVREATAKSMPVLSLIAEYTRNDRFKQLVFSEAKTEFKREGEVIELNELVLQSDGLVRVEGDITILGESLEGVCRVGVSPGTLRWIPGAEQEVFTESKDGFLWAPLNLTGTVSEPREDLSGRLIAAAGEEILNALPEGILKEAYKFLPTNPDGDDSAADPSDLIEQAKPLLDMLSPFLKRP
ncbi:MAG: hypothetical protein P1U68_12665 [Verrucomicrobiales bacterium]|nr:hypothetical protein [Verrucomicrobiales bacterium]